MIQYGIFDENEKIVGEFETIEEGLEALKKMNDGEIQSYGRGKEPAYYTEHYDLVRGLYSRVCKGKTELQFKEGAPIESLSAEKLGIILSYEPCDELEDLLVTLDVEKARALYDSLPTPPLTWNEETRTMVVNFYYLETEDTQDGDMALYYKCSPFTYEDAPTVCNMCGNEFDEYDFQENCRFDHRFGYGSKYDFYHLELNLCCECTGKVLDWLLPQCKHDPVTYDPEPVSFPPATDKELDEIFDETSEGE